MRKGSLSNPTGTHLSEATFRRFEDHLRTITNLNGEPYVVSPSNIAASTFTSQIRCAANAYINFAYTSDIPHSTFCSLWPTLVVRPISKTEVCIVARGTPVTPEPSTTFTSVSASFFTTLTNPTVEQLNALAFLHSTNVTPLPSLIVGPLPPGFELPLNLILQQTDEGNHLLM